MNFNKISIKNIVRNLLSMHLAAITPWQPNKFVALDLVTADWGDDDFERARTAQQIADGFLTGMGRGG